MSNENPKSPPFATGIGYDVHAFEDGRDLYLGGVKIPSQRGLKGHSDADVLLHAVCDALLGAAGLPDIGHFFPNTDDTWKDVSSRVLLKEVLKSLTEKGWSIGNVDVMLIAEEPKVNPHIEQMKEAISLDIQIPRERIGIKATTNESMGFVGRKEGIAALATVLIFR